ncbi:MULTISPECIES: Wzz/FepE/Etk N-terminal domain-containing protein [Halomonadaceae]|uniref:Wzz/FepE/Etk N-terminal domain-containing protein n=1 Tax=Halomonadaceae TaxID=28256 RepID=UPI001582A695|nr:MULTISPECIES: Wzz/FepE/Etk N-terminal domain-containing protein [Halomonas]MDI4639044.1 Wzz/FepE/Etk N-terminal domain-containing protein [Halomonas sp. BMC7]NUJ60034.1 lipopolysaccharide biosynthesis protein [Halomonas taeanensis]
MTEQRSSYDDEISLVDLAAILVRRWKAMAIIFAVVVLAAFAYVLTMTPTYSYVSVYDVAEQAPVGEGSTERALESANTVIAKAQSLAVAPVTRELLQQSGLESLPFAVDLSTPEDTQLVKITSQASEANSALVEKMHSALLDNIASNQQALVDRQRASLESRLESLQDSLEAAEQSASPSAADLLASYSEQIAMTKDRLGLLKDGRIAQTAQQSLEKTGTSRTLIMALALVLGGMLSVMGVFLMQFAGLVCSSLKQQEL